MLKLGQRIGLAVAGVELIILAIAAYKAEAKICELEKRLETVKAYASRELKEEA